MTAQHLSNLERSLQACKDRLSRAIDRKDSHDALIARQHIQRIEYKIEKVKEFYD